MNKKLIWSLLIGTTLCFTGCSDDDIVEENIYPSSNSEDIGIGANGSYNQSEKNSRTIYTGVENGTVEYINWIDGVGGTSEGYNWSPDEILIYSPQARTAELMDTASYRLSSHFVVNTDGTQASTGYAEMFTSMTKWYQGAHDNVFSQVGPDQGLFKVSGSPSGLRWDKQTLDDKKAHQFFAVYPSPNLNPSVELTHKTDDGSVWFTGAISSSQHTIGYIKDPKADSKAEYNTYIAMPVMRQNYMYAVHEATSEEIKNNSIGLQFKTIPTVLEVELVWPDNAEDLNYTVQGVMLSSKTQELAGKFKASLDPKGDYPKNVTLLHNESNTTQKSVYVDLDSDLKDGVAGVKMKGGDHLKVRFLLIPQELDEDQMSLTVIATGEKTKGVTVKGMKSHVLKTSQLDILPHKLNKIKNIQLPLTLEGNNWLTLMDDNILLSQLSIPGTGNSYIHSKNTSGWQDEQHAQVLDIPGQWGMGIRCFEVSIDANGDTGFGARNIRISNKEQTAKPFGDEVTSLLDLLEKNPGEFAMVIVRYQPGGEGRSTQHFVGLFETYFRGVLETNKDKFCIFQPGMPLSDARGKIMFVLCPTSEGEDALGAIKTDSTLPYLMIDGCGSLPDKFHKRGYKYKKEKVKEPVISDCANNEGVNLEQTAEHYMTPELIENLSVKFDDANFTYHTNITGFDAYYQEWTRVIDGAGLGIVAFGNYSWKSSYDEKLAHVKSTFNKAVTNKTNTEKVYINSLCGFLVSPGETNADLYQPLIGGHWPALRGNIKALSDKMNLDFYKYMHGELSKGAVKGPMGVVLMNRIGNPAVNGSMLMPHMVIMNNFSFPLLTSGGTSKSATRALSCSPSGEAGELDASDWKW